MSAPVLVCFAVPQEARPFSRKVAARPGIRVLVTGMGPKNAERSVREALSKEDIAQVFTCGFAGGLDPALQIGEVIYDAPDDLTARRLMAAGAHAARFCCSGTIAVTAAAKAALRQQTGAAAVEMESAVIQRLCVERQLSCATVRAISDRADEDLPLDFNQLETPDHQLSPWKLAWAIVRTPHKLPALMRLGRNSAAAAERLAAVLAQVIG